MFHAGCRVRVLRGREFPEFRGRQEGAVLDVNEECRNCHVLFDGREDPVQVAFKHLRISTRAADSAQAKNAKAEDGPSVEELQAENRQLQATRAKLEELLRLSYIQSKDAEDLQREIERKAQASVEELSEQLQDSEQAVSEVRCQFMATQRELSIAREEELRADLAAARSEAEFAESRSEVAALETACERETDAYDNARQSAKHEVRMRKSPEKPMSQAAEWQAECQRLLKAQAAMQSEHDTSLKGAAELARLEAETCRSLRAELRQAAFPGLIVYLPTLPCWARLMLIESCLSKRISALLLPRRKGKASTMLFLWMLALKMGPTGVPPFSANRRR
ncbi:unnamed protein product [Polarella glacialis]|uniref:Uncharacterized protein n=1 Tax=Polarella glacialis TaxID=89957 RepID=A0A813K2D2_POLGL|nr:unnamed protein product [Polarella glacialis]